MKWLKVLLISCSCLTFACTMSARGAFQQEAAQAQVEATQTMPASESTLRTVCAESLHVRVAPMGEVRGYLFSGESVEVFEPVDGWSQVAAGKWRGLWVRESWLCQK